VVQWLNNISCYTHKIMKPSSLTDWNQRSTENCCVQYLQGARFPVTLYPSTNTQVSHPGRSLSHTIRTSNLACFKWLFNSLPYLTECNTIYPTVTYTTQRSALRTSNYPCGTRINFLVGNAEDQNLNEIYIMKATKCGHLDLMFSVMSITLCEAYTRH
jgi:hypothetical protein